MVIVAWRTMKRLVVCQLSVVVALLTGEKGNDEERQEKTSATKTGARTLKTRRKNGTSLLTTTTSLRPHLSSALPHGLHTLPLLRARLAGEIEAVEEVEAEDGEEDGEAP